MDGKLQVGPGRVTPNRGGTKEEPQCSTTFGRQLQPAEVMHIELRQWGINRPHAPAAERLVESPKFVLLANATNHKHLLEAISPLHRCRRVEAPLAVHHHQGLPLAASLPGREQSQCSRSAPRLVGQPFHQCPAQKTSSRQQPVQLPTAGGEWLFVLRLAASFQPGHLLAQVVDESWRGHGGLRWTPLTRPGVDYDFMLVCLAARGPIPQVSRGCRTRRGDYYVHDF